MENISERIIISKKLAEVISIRELTESTYVLRFSRNNFEFQSGQYIVIGLQGSKLKREYSIYSSVTSPYLEVLIKEVDNGIVSHNLRHCKPGDILEIEGPFGHFVLDERKIPGRKFLFVASGTGISPFHSMIKSNPHLVYSILHGVRTANEAYDRHDYEPGNYILCTSKDNRGDFYGRVTDYLHKNPQSNNIYCYLCGNGAMVEEVYAILENQGIPSERIYTEIYF